jgi:Uma2 family endonuclease
MTGSATKEVETFAPVESLAEWMGRIGDVPPERIRMRPYPGTATERDLVEAVESKFGRLCELVDGALVEKLTGWYESRLATVLNSFLEPFLSEHDLGIGPGPGAPVRTQPGQVRLPNVSFLAWNHFPGRVLPSGAILGVAPDFVVEILSPTNTPREMERKRREYFGGGARLVWELDPEARRMRVYTSADQFTEIGEEGTLDGGAVLPGFTLPLRAWFERAGRRAEGG